MTVKMQYTVGKFHRELCYKILRISIALAKKVLVFGLVLELNDAL